MIDGFYIFMFHEMNSVQQGLNENYHILRKKYYIAPYTYLSKVFYYTVVKYIS